MDRRDFLMMLARAVSDGVITEAQAMALRDQYDRGELDPETLPLPPDEAITTITGEDAAAALLLLAVLLSRPRSTPETILGGTIARREMDRDILQDIFGQQMREAAILPTKHWHAIMQALVRDNILDQYALGLGRPLTDAEIRALQPMIQTQMAYLQRFVDERAARQLIGRPLSEAQIAARAQLYSGPGRIAFFQAHETTLGAGWVCVYEARDDISTCSPCLSAEKQSPFLPGQGIFPAQVCRGRGHCRCIRRDVYNPKEYARLTGGTP